MVQYFMQHAWVQSYGSRYVRPPIIFGDVSRTNVSDKETPSSSIGVG